MPWSVRFDPIILGLPIVDFPTHCITVESLTSPTIALSILLPVSIRFCLFLSVSVCLSDVFTRSYTADACTMQPSGKNSHIIPFFFYDGVTMMFAMIIMVVILMVMIEKITKNIQIL